MTTPFGKDALINPIRPFQSFTWPEGGGGGGGSQKQGCKKSRLTSTD